MNRKIISFIVSIVVIAAAVGAAVFAIANFINKKKEKEEAEVYDNYVECCCEPDELSQVSACDCEKPADASAEVAVMDEENPEE